MQCAGGRPWSGTGGLVVEPGGTTMSATSRRTATAAAAAVGPEAHPGSLPTPGEEWWNYYITTSFSLPDR